MWNLQPFLLLSTLWLFPQWEPVGTYKSAAITKMDLVQNHLIPVTEHTEGGQLKEALWGKLQSVFPSLKTVLSLLSLQCVLCVMAAALSVCSSSLVTLSSWGSGCTLQKMEINE